MTQLGKLEQETERVLDALQGVLTILHPDAHRSDEGDGVVFSAADDRLIWKLKHTEAGWVLLDKSRALAENVVEVLAEGASLVACLVEAMRFLWEAFTEAFQPIVGLMYPTSSTVGAAAA